MTEQKNNKTDLEKKKNSEAIEKLRKRHKESKERPAKKNDSGITVSDNLGALFAKKGKEQEKKKEIPDIEKGIETIISAQLTPTVLGMDNYWLKIAREVVLIRKYQAFLDSFTFNDTSHPIGPCSIERHRSEESKKKYADIFLRIYTEVAEIHDYGKYVELVSSPHTEIERALFFIKYLKAKTIHQRESHKLTNVEIKPTFICINEKQAFAAFFACEYYGDVAIFEDRAQSIYCKDLGRGLII